MIKFSYKKMFRSSSEAEALEALWSGAVPALVLAEDFRRPKSVSASFHYFSDTGILLNFTVHSYFLL